jgi:phosphatidylethanolamine N-methyltransferase
VEDGETAEESDSATPHASGPHPAASLEVPGLSELDVDVVVDDDDNDGRDPDDFTIMNETQAKRIVSLCEMTFGVEISPDVVIADANVGLLANRVVGARSLIAPKGVYGGGAGAKVS